MYSTIHFQKDVSKDAIAVETDRRGEQEVVDHQIRDNGSEDNETGDEEFDTIGDELYHILENLASHPLPESFCLEDPTWAPSHLLPEKILSHILHIQDFSEDFSNYLKEALPPLQQFLDDNFNLKCKLSQAYDSESLKATMIKTHGEFLNMIAIEKQKLNSTSQHTNTATLLNMFEPSTTMKELEDKVTLWTGERIAQGKEQTLKATSVRLYIKAIFSPLRSTSLIRWVQANINDCNSLTEVVFRPDKLVVPITNRWLAYVNPKESESAACTHLNTVAFKLFTEYLIEAADEQRYGPEDHLKSWRRDEYINKMQKFSKKLEKTIGGKSKAAKRAAQSRKIEEEKRDPKCTEAVFLAYLKYFNSEHFKQMLKKFADAVLKSREDPSTPPLTPEELKAIGIWLMLNLLYFNGLRDVSVSLPFESSFCILLLFFFLL